MTHPVFSQPSKIITTSAKDLYTLEISNIVIPVMIEVIIVVVPVDMSVDILVVVIVDVVVYVIVMARGGGSRTKF